MDPKAQSLTPHQRITASPRCPGGPATPPAAKMPHGHRAILPWVLQQGRPRSCPAVSVLRSRASSYSRGARKADRVCHCTFYSFPKGLNLALRLMPAATRRQEMGVRYKINLVLLLFHLYESIRFLECC